MQSILRDLIPIKYVMGNRFGIEIEVEGAYLPHPEPNTWNRVGDGSLRGNAAEYVLEQPSYQTVVKKQLEYLINLFLENGKGIDPSDRCGIHVHTNVQNLKLSHLYNMLILYFIAEDLLIEKVSPERKGNLFCLSGQDAEGLIDFITLTAGNGRIGILEAPTNDLKYSALNIVTLHKFGTLEWRAMSTPKNVKDWIKVMPVISFFSGIKAAARKFEHPVQIVEKLSMDGPKSFIKEFYPFLVGLEKTENEVHESILEGVRVAQDIAYAYVEDKQKCDE